MNCRRRENRFADNLSRIDFRPLTAPGVNPCDRRFRCGDEMRRGHDALWRRGGCVRFCCEQRPNVFGQCRRICRGNGRQFQRRHAAGHSPEPRKQLRFTASRAMRQQYDIRHALVDGRYRDSARLGANQLEPFELACEARQRRAVAVSGVDRKYQRHRQCGNLSHISPTKYR